MSAPKSDARPRRRATQPSKPSNTTPSGTSTNAVHKKRSPPPDRKFKHRKIAIVPEAALPMVNASASAYDRSIENRRVDIGFLNGGLATISRPSGQLLQPVL